MMKRHNSLSAGFTMVELSIVLLIGGMIMMTGTVMLASYLQEIRMMTTQNRMNDIDNAIIQYLNVNGVLPCTASLKDKQDTNKFGHQLTDTVYPAAADCAAAVANAAGGAFKIAGEVPGALGAAVDPRTPTTNNTGLIVIGAVPVRDLGLPDQEMTDAWGDRFVYAVTDTLTVGNSYDPTQGSIFVHDSGGVDIAQPPGSAQYVIVSLGADHAGAYTTDGVKGVACPAGEVETPNCTYPTNTFIQTTLNSNKPGTANMYDDYVTYHTQINASSVVPSGFVAPFAIAPLPPPPGKCPSGWIPYTQPASSPTVCPPLSADYICCQKL